MTATTAGSAASAPARNAAFGPFRRELFAFAELFAVAGLAFAQPAFDLLSKNVTLFVERNTQPWQVLALTVMFLLGPPAIAYAFELLLALFGAAARRWTHAVLVGLFVGLMIAQVVKHGAGLHGTPVILLGLAAAVFGTLLVARVDLVHTFLRFLAIAPILFAVVFVGFSPVSKTVFGHEPQSASGATIGNPKRVVMMVMDEFPLGTLLDGNGKIDASLYPNFARLAATSNWYRNTTTVAPYTDWAVPAIDSGRYPHDDKAIPAAVDYPDTIFRLLGGAYRMNVHEPVTKLCPESLCPARVGQTNSIRNLAGTVRASLRLWSDFAKPGTTPPAKFEPPLSVPSGVAGGTEFVRSLRPGTDRQFDYLHVMLPHQPWHYLPTLQDVGYNQDGDLSTKSNLLKWQDEASASIGRERHILQTQAADTLLGQIIDKLEKSGSWNDSTVVLTADHGVSFNVGEPIRSATNNNIDQLLWVPMFVKAPGQTAGTVDDRPMQTVDIVPTIADIIDAKIPWKVDGVSALGKPRAEFERRLYEYKLAHLQPPGSLISENGKPLMWKPGPLWARVLGRQAAAPVGDPALRPYRIGEYGSLVGQAAAPLVKERPDGDTKIFVVARDEFDSVDLTAPAAPWAAIQGSVLGIDSQRPIAFAVNGVIAGFGYATPYRGANNGYFWASLAPSLFRNGSNDLQAYFVSGPANSPSLDRVPVDAAGSAPSP